MEILISNFMISSEDCTVLGNEVSSFDRYHVDWGFPSDRGFYPSHSDQHSYLLLLILMPNFD